MSQASASPLACDICASRALRVEDAPERDEGATVASTHRA